MPPKLKATDLSAVAKTLDLLSQNPPKDEHWDTQQRHGPNLETRLRAWLKEQL